LHSCVAGELNAVSGPNEEYTLKRIKMLGEAWARSVGRWEEAEASGGSGKQPWRFVAWANGPLTYSLELTWLCATSEGLLMEYYEM